MDSQASCSVGKRVFLHVKLFGSSRLKRPRVAPRLAVDPRERTLRSWLRVFSACPCYPAGPQVLSSGDEEEVLKIVADVYGVYKYVFTLEEEGAAPTETRGFVEAVHLTHVVLDIDQIVTRRLKRVVLGR
eukprot:3013694-Amphidinium_carterae.1